MHLYNILVSYRDDNSVYYNLEQSIFRNDCTNNGQTSEVIGNNSIRLNEEPSVSLNDA